MCRSVLNVTPAEFKKIRDCLPKKTDKQRATRRNFDISQTDRDMLAELVQLLEAFEWVTNELQGDTVTISKVYPCIEYLLNELKRDLSQRFFTKELRKALTESLEERFGVLIRTEVFVVSSYLGKIIF